MWNSWLTVFFFQHFEYVTSLPWFLTESVNKLIEDHLYVMTSVFSWQNSTSLCPASFCTPRPNLRVTPGVSLLPTFTFQSPIMKRTSLVGVSSKRSCRPSPFNFSFFSVTDQGIDLDYHDIEWFALEMNRDHSVIFETAAKYCILDSFDDYDGYSISSKGILAPQSWSSELNSPIPVYFSLLIPKMLIFILATSCFTTSSLPWLRT